MLFYPLAVCITNCEINQGITITVLEFHRQLKFLSVIDFSGLYWSKW